MSQLKSKWKATGYTIAAIVIAIVFLIVGLSSLGSVKSTGKAYTLKQDTKVVFRLEKQDGQTNLKNIWFNVGTVYNEVGSTATVKIRRSTTSASNWYTSYLGEAKLDNMFSDEESSAKSVSFNWFAPYDLSSASYSLSSYPCYELSATTCDLLINEVVFVADDGTIIPATIDEDASTGIDAEKAAALVDSPYLPSTVQSSFFSYGEEEAYSLMTISEIRMGKLYSDGAVYHIDSVNNALGYDLMTLSVLIFGTSPFGLRFLPFLACFGCLVVGYFLVKRMTKSDKASFAFVLTFALCGLTLTVGRWGNPFFIGLFFFLLSTSLAHKFYAEGMEKANVKSALPLLFSGVFGGLAICVNGAFSVMAVVPIALFAAGMVRQQKAKAYRLEKVEAEGETAADPSQEGSAPVTVEEKKQTVRAEYRYKNQTASLLFFGALIITAFLISLFALLPAYSTFIKAYDDPSSPTLNLFTLLWKGFVGGFVGANAVTRTQSGWRFFYELFVGTGSTYARTLAVVNFAAIAVGGAGLIYSIVRAILLLVRKENGKQARAEWRSILIPLGGMAVSLLVAIFARPGVGFVTLAYLFSFMLAGNAFRAIKNHGASVAVLTVSCVLLGLCFVALGAFTFSIPLPSSVFVKIFG